MSTPLEMSMDEIIALLKKTSLPTIVIEGSDDVIIYRKLEERLSDKGVSILPVGGRSRVIEIFNRRNELNAVKITFIADKDCFVYEGVPPDLEHELLFFTDGYSIENDVYRDGDLPAILTEMEAKKYHQDLEKFIRWYALAMSRFIEGQDSNLSLHPDNVFESYDELSNLQSGEDYPENLRLKISEDYGRLLRGKSLLTLLVKHASYRGRGVRHHTKSLLETVAARPGPLISNLFSRVSERFVALA
ncbi:DUF4435 domain-containing protein [Xanthomonas euroxanthea]|uniref:DUF4435 domain-containing protein n=1 Tax=Xanthomonas euroxanthea TaxID=2259622 RepID=A0A8E4EGM9_9XANT|nr:DUF4435 domain-containing protein [Xanthomonas euroxanthea]CAD1785834.1 DUF4435 domain-containing protein [Xanthomonas euroxanthea]SYZ50674.1 hypothetical protein CPBF367_00620 [Xanthomonas arboricola pv. juglandis]